MFSKKLLSEVIGIPDVVILSISRGVSIVSLRKINGVVEEYNIYELAYKCKKWAFDIGYFVETKALSSKLRSREYGSKVLDECFNTNWDNGIPYDPVCDIKVCEWIVENDDVFSPEN